MPDYTCDAVDNAFLMMSEFLSPTILSRTTPSMRPLFTSTPRGEWVDGMGTTHTNVIFERTVPTDTGNEWVATAPSDGADVDNCTLDPEVVHFGQTKQTVEMFRRNLQTQEFCVEDLRNDFALRKTLEGVEKNLRFLSIYVWETYLQARSITLSDHKITEGGAGVYDLNSTSFSGGNPPTSTLTLGTLEQIYNYLKLDGASMEGSVGSAGLGRPIFDLFTDANTSRDTILQDPDLRQDYRYAFMGKGIDSPLLQTLGTPFTHAGFRHVELPWPQRFNFPGGVMTRVYPYKNPAAASKGVKQDINPAYLYAAAQISLVRLPSLFTLQIPKPITSPGAGMQFDPVNYMGDFQWLNIKDKKCNPRGQKGFFDAVFAAASEPGLTNHGFAILHKNCPPNRQLRTSCYEAAGYEA